MVIIIMMMILMARTLEDEINIYKTLEDEINIYIYNIGLFVAKVKEGL